jgi:GNAT superfamily N-acetyltransferase
MATEDVQSQFDLRLTDTFDAHAESVIEDGLARFNKDRAGFVDSRALAVLAHEPGGGDVVGGLLGRTTLGLFFVDLIFLPASARGQGLGSRVMALAEEEARRRGAVHHRIPGAGLLRAARISRAGAGRMRSAWLRPYLHDEAAGDAAPIDPRPRYAVVDAPPPEPPPPEMSESRLAVAEAVEEVLDDEPLDMPPPWWCMCCAPPDLPSLSKLFIAEVICPSAATSAELVVAVSEVAATEPVDSSDAAALEVEDSALLSPWPSALSAVLRSERAWLEALVTPLATPDATPAAAWAASPAAAIRGSCIAVRKPSADGANWLEALEGALWAVGLWAVGLWTPGPLALAP